MPHIDKFVSLSLYFPVVHASCLGGLDIQEESWLMSSEGKDRTYRPAKKASRGPERESYRTRRQEVVDYMEVDTIDLDTSGTVNQDSGQSSAISRSQGNGREGFLGSVGFQDDWTPNTLRQTASKVNQQFERQSQVNTADHGTGVREVWRRKTHGDDALHENG